MSTLEAVRVAEPSRFPLQLVVVATPKLQKAVPKNDEEHALLPVFVIGMISLILSSAMVGWILVWLAIRYSGVLAR
jgi:hypothetical protein